MILAPATLPQRTPVAAAVSRNHEFPEKLQPLFVRGRWRYKVLYGGRGGAKSWGVARALLLMGTTTPLRILCAREVQKSISESVHQLLKDQINNPPDDPDSPGLAVADFYQVLENEIRGRNGTLFKFAGLSQSTAVSIKSFEGFDICWVEEGQSISKRSWDLLTPTIRKRGSEIWVTLNPDMDTDETWVRFCEHPDPRVLRIEINWRDNPWFALGELEAERQADIGKPDYDNKWEGKPKRVAAGAIYRHEIESLYSAGRLTDIPYDPVLPVHTVWDLGWNDAMAIACVQRGPHDLRVLRYFEDTGRRLDWYVAELEKMAAPEGWRWGSDFIPHDGAAKNYITGKSTEEHLQDLRRRPHVLERLGIEEGIKAARMEFPRVVFNRPHTTRLIECLRRYRRAVPVKTDEPAAPLHDEFSHGADCFRYLCQAAPLMSNGLDTDAVRNFVNRDRSKRLWKR